MRGSDEIECLMILAKRVADSAFWLRGFLGGVVHVTTRHLAPRDLRAKITSSRTTQ